MLQQTNNKNSVEQNSSTGSGLTELVVKARSGNRKAFEELFDIYHARIFRMVFYRTRSRADAEDLTQEIFIKAYKNLPRLKGVKRFQSWLYTIAINRTRDFHRRGQFRKLFTLFSDKRTATPANDSNNGVSGPVAELMKLDFWEQVGKFLNHLPPGEREVFTLRFLDHQTIKEISQVLGKSESTVKTQLYRALGKFKKASSLRQWLQEKIQ